MKEVKKALNIEIEKCTGCDSCVLACSFKHTGNFSLRSLIEVVKVREEGLYVPVMCQHCSNAPCVAACPSGALVKNNSTGETKLLTNLCIGCRMCTTVCPFGAITYSKNAGHMEKCDLCSGEPACVAHCMPQALSYCEIDDMAESKRVETALKQVEAKKAE